MGAVVVKCANCGYRNRVPAATAGVPRAATATTELAGLGMRPSGTAGKL